MKTKVERVVVTGSTGCLGSAVVRALGNRAVPVCRASHGDIRKAVPAWFEGADAVMHMAGAIPQRGYSAEELESINVDGARCVFEAARSAGVRIPLLVSTAAVYGVASEWPLSEACSPAPESPYARAMLAAEEVLAKTYEGSGCIIRVFNLYGPGSISVVDRVCSAVSEGRGATIRPHTGVVRDFIHVDDVADGLIAMLGKEGLFNLGTGTGHDLATLVELVKRQRPNASIDAPAPELRAPPNVSIANVDKARRAGVSAPDRLASYVAQLLPASLGLAYRALGDNA